VDVRGKVLLMLVKRAFRPDDPKFFQGQGPHLPTGDGRTNTKRPRAKGAVGVILIHKETMGELYPWEVVAELELGGEVLSKNWKAPSARKLRRLWCSWMWRRSWPPLSGPGTSTKIDGGTRARHEFHPVSLGAKV